MTDYSELAKRSRNRQASVEAVKLGFTGIREVSEIVKLHSTTLARWMVSRPELFTIVLIGARETIRRDNS